MSQAKVDAYKQQKKNRDKMMKREKRIMVRERLLVIVVAAAIVFWIGFSIYRYNDSRTEKEISYTEVDLSAVNDFSNALAETE